MSCLLEWREATCLWLVWDYRILVVNIPSKDKIELEYVWNAAK